MKQFALIISLLSLATTTLAQPYFPVRLNDRWGAIDRNGKIVLQPKYDRVDAEGEKE